MYPSPHIHTTSVPCHASTEVVLMAVPGSLLPSLGFFCSQCVAVLLSSFLGVWNSSSLIHAIKKSCSFLHYPPISLFLFPVWFLTGSLDFSFFHHVLLHPPSASIRHSGINERFCHLAALAALIMTEGKGLWMMGSKEHMSTASSARRGGVGGGTA